MNPSYRSRLIVPNSDKARKPIKHAFENQPELRRTAEMLEEINQQCGWQRLGIDPLLLKKKINPQNAIGNYRPILALFFIAHYHEPNKWLTAESLHDLFTRKKLTQSNLRTFTEKIMGVLTSSKLVKINRADRTYRLNEPKMEPILFPEVKIAKAGLDYFEQQKGWEALGLSAEKVTNRLTYPHKYGMRLPALGYSIIAEHAMKDKHLTFEELKTEFWKKRIVLNPEQFDRLIRELRILKLVKIKGDEIHFQSI